MIAKRWTWALLALFGVLPLWSQAPSDTLREVVVTGTGTEHLLKDAPVQTEIISRRTLDTYGGRSLEDILSGLTASFAFNEGDMGSQMQLGGLGNSYILILVDGKRLHGDVGGENDLGLIDPQNIDHIEIVRGAHSALYGSDAMAGVINIITRKPQNDKRWQLENATRYGSHNDVRQHNSVAMGWGKWTTVTSLQSQHTDGWRNTTLERTEGKVVEDSRNKTVNKYTNWQLGEQIGYQATKDIDLYAEGSYYTKTILRPQDGNYPSCDVYTYDLMYRNAHAGVGGKWKLRDHDQVTLDVDWNKHAYFYQFTATTLMDGYDPNGQFTNYYPWFAGQHSLQSDQQRATAHLKGVFHLPAENTLSTGAEFRYDYLHAPMRTSTGTADDWTAALYVQDEFNLVSWLHLTAGLRLNQNAGFGFKATPKLNALLSLGDFRARLGWSQGFKTPTTKELHYRYLHAMGASTYFNMGNTNLQAQTSNYLSGNLEYRGRRLTVSATVYHNRLNDMIALVNVSVSEIPPGITSGFLGDGSSEIIARMYKNMEDARTWGVDLNASYQITREWSVAGNYSYLDTDAHEYDSKHDRLVHVTIDGMAHHRWNANTTWIHRFLPRYRMGVILSTRGSSKRYYQNDGNGRKYQIWRINTTHDLGRQDKPMSYRLEAGVDNLLNQVDRTMHPLHLGTTTPGTSVYVGVTIKFHQGKAINSHKNNSLKQQEDED